MVSTVDPKIGSDLSNFVYKALNFFHFFRKFEGGGILEWAGGGLNWEYHFRCNQREINKLAEAGNWIGNFYNGKCCWFENRNGFIEFRVWSPQFFFFHFFRKFEGFGGILEGEGAGKLRVSFPLQSTGNW